MTSDTEKRTEQPLEISLINQFLGNLLMGDPDEGGDVRIVRVQKDGTLRMWTLAVGLSTDGAERVLATEPTGELRSVPLGRDSALALQALRVDLDRVLQNRPYEPVLVLADGQLPNSTTVLFTVGATRSLRVRWCRAVNTSAVSTETVIIRANVSGSNRIIGRAILGPLEAQDFLSGLEELQLESGDTISGESTTAATVDYVIAGEEEILP